MCVEHFGIVQLGDYCEYIASRSVHPSLVFLFCTRFVVVVAVVVVSNSNTNINIYISDDTQKLYKSRQPFCAVFFFFVSD